MNHANERAAMRSPGPPTRAGVESETRPDAEAVWRQVPECVRALPVFVRSKMAARRKAKRPALMAPRQRATPAPIPLFRLHSVDNSVNFECCSNTNVHKGKWIVIQSV